MKKQFVSHLNLGIKNLKIAAKILIQMIRIYVKGSYYNVNHQNRMFEEKKAVQLMNKLTSESEM